MALSVSAQTTAFTYQGLLNSSGAAANGSYDLRFALYDAASNGVQQGATLTNTATAVSNGYFTVTLDFGNQFPVGNRWLEIAVRTNGGGAFSTLSPRQAITATPYAVRAANFSGLVGDNQLSVNISRLGTSIDSSEITDGTIVNADINAAAGIADTKLATISTAGKVANSATTATSANTPSAIVARDASAGFSASTITASNLVGGGAGLTALNASQLASGTVPDARLGTNVARTNQVWLLNGNSDTDPATNFLGTTDNRVLELRANGTTALRLSRIDTTGVPNLIGGFGGNTVEAGYQGVVIAGGGGAGVTNRVLSGNATTISGGSGNTVSGEGAVIGGGVGNSATAQYATVGGGSGNTVAGATAVIAGGYLNDISVDSDHTTIGGGQNNNIAADSVAATIAGGWDNDIGSNAIWSAIGGGQNNNIAEDAWAAAIGGGSGNAIKAASGGSRIGGGSGNGIGPSSYYAAIVCGYNNNIHFQSSHSAIGGGVFNSINYNSENAVIAGGLSNLIGSSSFWSTIGGGHNNSVSIYSHYATIPGGYFNVATNYAFAAGRQAKANHTGAFVWADSQDADFASSATNQFLIRASGGVGINTINPGGASLSVNGGIRARGGAPGGGGVNNNGYAFNGSGGDNDSGLFSSADGQLEFYNNAQERVRITSIGRVGIGVASPDTLLHVKETVQDVALLESSATGGTWVGVKNTSTGGKDWKFISTGSGNGEGPGNLLLFVDGARRFEFRPNGDFITTGTVNPPSDRNVKQDFAPADPLAVLEKVARLPIQSWAYTNDATIRHLGPVAQDFHAAFGLGTDDRHIATVDADGVALAAIQGLNQKLEQKETELMELKQRLEKLEQLLTHKLNGGAK